MIVHLLFYICKKKCKLVGFAFNRSFAGYAKRLMHSRKNKAITIRNFVLFILNIFNY